MKILHIIDHMSLGGAQRIVEGILQSDPAAVLLALRRKGVPQDQILVPAGQVLDPPQGGLLRQMLRLPKTMRRIRQQQFAIIHCHLPFSWYFGLLLHRLLPARHRPAFIFHEHDSIKLERPSYSSLARAAHRAGTLVAVSEYTRAQIASHGIPRADILLLHNFVDSARFSPGSSDPQRFGLPAHTHDARLVGFAGRLVGYKGWHAVLESAGRLSDQNICFLIAGHGPDAGRLAGAIQEMKLSGKVIPLGYVDDMPAFYRLLDVLLIASQREAFGLVQLEAQAYGVPVILFDSQAARELHGSQSTVIVPHGDAAALAQEIERLLQHPDEYDALVAKGLENALKFDRPAYMQKLADVYAQALKGEVHS
jgi:glycosyltransferase involved in cell wall biosynthesis